MIPPGADGRALRIETNAQGNVAVHGAITFYNAADALRAAPQAPGEGMLDVDLSALTGADSVCLAVLIAWAAQAHTRGSQLRYLTAPQGLCNLAHLSDVDGLLGL